MPFKCLACCINRCVIYGVACTFVLTDDVERSCPCRVVYVLHSVLVINFQFGLRVVIKESDFRVLAVPLLGTEICLA